MSVSVAAIVEQIQSLLPDAIVTATDLTGGGDHFAVRVISSEFDGKTSVARHRLVHQALATELKGDIHALQLETLTPKEVEEK